MSESAEKLYRFTREAFGPLSFYPLHYDLLFDVRETTVRVTAKQTYIYQGEEETSSCLLLNCHNLEIHSVGLFKTSSKLGPPTTGIEAIPPNFVAHVSSFKDLQEISFTVNEKDRLLEVQLPSPVSQGEEIVIQTVSTCRPNDHDLEGIYFDYTPDGAPQTMITQCQQYGFQRIVPCVDRMISKLFYTTTIVADKRYTNLISNGDLADGFFDSDNNPQYQSVSEVFGEQSEQILPEYSGPERHVLRYYNHKVNMAPYLFFLGVGTYEVYRRSVEYPRGEEFQLELVCFPNIVKPQHAAAALKALHDSIIWLYVSCGEEAYCHKEEEQQIFKLIQEREAIKEKLQGTLVHRIGDPKQETKLGDEEREQLTSKLVEIRHKLSELSFVWKETGYCYTGTCYREIAMENSNYGGMENVGNTTILSSRLTPSDWLIDGAYIYMEGVKIHEFYHNINGSQVTGASPFEIWLNEAVTVHIQRQREYDLFGHDLIRLRHVQYAFTPASGPLAQDRSPVSMAVEPIGFNTTHELISAMTYSKAPEFVRMVELILGPEGFSRALANYHKKFAFGNATTLQWIEEMSALAPDDVDLVEMSRGWLNRTGYPTVTVRDMTYEASSGQVSVEFEQSGFPDDGSENSGPWLIPIDWALVKDGKNIRTGVYVFRKAKSTFVISDVHESPDFISVGRDWSFFGDVHYDSSAASASQRMCQALSDPDTVNRYLAVQSIVDNEKAKLIRALVSKADKSELVVSDECLKLFGSILTDSSLSNSSRAKLLTIDEAISNYPELGHHYFEIADAKTILQHSIYENHGETVLRVFKELFAVCQVVRPQGEGIADRMMMHWCFSILQAGADKPSVSVRGEVADSLKSLDLLEHLKTMLGSYAMSDKYFALQKILQLRNIEETERQQILDDAKAIWTVHPIGCEQYISCVAYANSHQAPKYIRQLMDKETSPFFNMALAGHARSIARGWCSDRKMAVLDPEGLKMTEELFLTIGKVNQMSAYSFFGAFSDLHKFDPETKSRLEESLRRMQSGLDASKQESLYNQLNILLSGKKDK